MRSETLVFLHVLAALALVGAALAAATLSLAAIARPGDTLPKRLTLKMLLGVAGMSVVTIALGIWLEGRQDANGTWIDVAHPLSEIGVFLGSLAAAFFVWRSLGRTAASRTAAVLAVLIVVLLGTVAVLMAGKPG
jgi:heme A synthase